MSSPVKTNVFKVASTVYWRWMGGAVKGKVVEIFTEPVERVIKGKKIKRNGSSTMPAYYVQSVAGNFALKLHTELFDTLQQAMRRDE